MDTLRGAEYEAGYAEVSLEEVPSIAAIGAITGWLESAAQAVDYNAVSKIGAFDKSLLKCGTGSRFDVYPLDNCI